MSIWSFLDFKIGKLQILFFLAHFLEKWYGYVTISISSSESMSTKQQLRTFWWSITFLYLGVLYISLGVTPRIWNRINAALGGEGVHVLYALYALTGFLLFGYLLFIKKERSLLKYGLFTFFIVAFGATVHFATYPAEKIHIAQYGGLGILIYKTLRITFSSLHKGLYLRGGIFCVVAGAVDELIQWGLPNRYFDWRDIFMNGISGIIVLLMIRGNFVTNSQRAA